MFRKCTFAFAALLGFAGLAEAGSNLVYSFELTRQGNRMVNQDGDRVAAGIRDKAGKILGVSGSYDSGNQEFSWSTTIGKNGSWSTFDGFWLVVNNGGNPKSLAQEGKLGMLYFDAWKEDITVYQYTGKGGKSYENGELIASTRLDDSFVKSLDITKHDNSKTASFTLDVAGINSALGWDWMGLQFGEQVGIWMHTFDHGQIKYRDNGSIKKWSFCDEGWLDTDGVPTHAVPTPTAAMAGLAGLGLLASRRKNAAA